MSEKRPRVLGCGSGRIWIADDFDAPLPDDILATLEEPIEPAAEHAPVPLVVPRQPKPSQRARDEIGTACRS